jgi:hypothetical protein
MTPTQQGADILAENVGCQIVMPDFFLGKPWDVKDFPPSDGKAFGAFLGATTYETVEKMLLQTIDYLKSSGVKKFGPPEPGCPLT